LIVVGLDTATRSTVAALVRTDAPTVEVQARDDPPRGARPRHATRLLGLVAEVLDRADVGWEAVDRIAVGVGPGTFTGLRIGVASARALARARGVELVGVSTLRSLATHGASSASPEGHRASSASPEGHGASWASPEGAELVLAVLDARRGEVFAAAWRRLELAHDGPAILSPGAFSPQALATRVAELGLPTLAIGDGAVEFREVLERAGALVPADESELHRVSAITHCQLAASMRGSSPDQVQPAYLRLPDAEISRRAADRQ
jgi:tRNA threonylcarbamoyladenosine biosynthesis protein TsaB